MANVLKARVVKIKKYNDDTVHVTCEMVESAILGFKGGQYIIVNSGKVLSNGKLGKRAYSILSSDKEQEIFELAIKKIPKGVGSGFMHDLRVNHIFEFSGPWGKYQISEEMKGERLLCIATDTGISAALGLLRAKAAAPFLSNSRLIWCISSLDYFIPLEEVRSWASASVSFQMISSLPSVNDPLRLAFVERHVLEMLKEETFTKIYLSGDGLVLRYLKTRFLESRNYQPEQIMLEAFFHHESLKTVTV